MELSNKTKIFLLILFLLIALLLNIFSSGYVGKVCSEQSFNINDFFHIQIDYDYSNFMKIAEVIIFFNLLIFLIYNFKDFKNPNLAKKYLFVIGFFYLLRM